MSTRLSTTASARSAAKLSRLPGLVSGSPSGSPEIQKGSGGSRNSSDLQVLGGTAGLNP
jgi:hypothetical protein